MFGQEGAYNVKYVDGFVDVDEDTRYFLIQRG